MKTVFVVSLIISSFQIISSIRDPEEYPNLLAGSFTDGGRFSTGNTLPLVGMPWGFNHWAPQTRGAGRNTGSWWFFGSDQTFTWMRCTHQPSPWIGDWGNFLFTPMLGESGRDVMHFWNPRSAIIKPYLFDTIIAPHNIHIELAPTEHAAIIRITFPETNEYGRKHLCFADLSYDNDQQGDLTSTSTLFGMNQNGKYFEAYTENVHSERMIVNHFKFRIRVESMEAMEIVEIHDLKCFRYKTSATTVTIRIATSLISREQALINFQREVPYEKSFEDILYEAKLVWNR
jgi:putative alpha-1,2-mannosidase